MQSAFNIVLFVRILCDLIILFTVNRIEDLTDNIRVGFGSFNDKLTRPYAYIPVPPPGGGACPVCDIQPPLYTFRHQITLTDNITFYNVYKQAMCFKDYVLIISTSQSPAYNMCLTRLTVISP